MRVAVAGARGFVGSAIMRALPTAIAVTRERPLDRPVDVLIHAACPGARLRAAQDPGWDHVECVVKTRRFVRSRLYDRFVHVSSLSARYPLDTIYGAHRREAEGLVPPDGLIVRLGPMYGRGLVKGVVLDLLADRTVYADPATRYSWADVDWCGEVIADLALTDETGIREVGGRGWLAHRALAAALHSRSRFEPSAYLPDREDQVVDDPTAPRSSLVIEWAQAYGRVRRISPTA